jgi:chemotaxis protein MotA
MDLVIIIGLILAFFGIIGGNIVEGGDPTFLLNPPGIMIVVLGTIGATVASQPLSTLRTFPKALMQAFTGSRKHDSNETVELLVQMADKSRREGLLALEAQTAEIEHPFLRKGVQLMIDGTDPELLREIMEIDVDAMKHRHEGHYSILEFAGGIAPTMGVLGAVLGLITVMNYLDQPDKIGHGIAVAFVATFYGIFTANVIFLPLANKLKTVSKHEIQSLMLIIEGLMSIQAGDNPRIVREKLEGFIEPAGRNSKSDDDLQEAA